MYQREAAKELGKGSGPIGTFMGAGEWLRGQGHTVKSQWNAARGAVEIMQVQGPKPLCSQGYIYRFSLVFVGFHRVAHHAAIKGKTTQLGYRSLVLDCGMWHFFLLGLHSIAVEPP